MSNNIQFPIIFIGHDNAPDLRCSLESFLAMNACALPKFHIVVLVCQPPAGVARMLRGFRKRINQRIVHPKPFHWPIVFTTLQTFEAEYTILIPPGWDSHAPIHPYLDQLVHVLDNYPDVCMIKLAPDTYTTNTSAAFHYVTPDVLIGNGTVQFDIPIMLRTGCPKSGEITTGRLKPLVFRRLPEGSA